VKKPVRRLLTENCEEAVRRFSKIVKKPVRRFLSKKL
tara:strand:+ start:307 stop:417 length:111 start_codon:yes stop_codon:yes gene_type:complete